MDQTSVVVIGIPLLVAALWIAYLLRPIPKDLLEKEKLFSDPDTGIVFQGEDGARPERDAKVRESKHWQSIKICVRENWFSKPLDSHPGQLHQRSKESAFGSMLDR